MFQALRMAKAVEDKANEYPKATFVKLDVSQLNGIALIPRGVPGVCRYPHPAPPPSSLPPPSL